MDCNYREDKMYTAISLYSGAGGLDIGFESVGFDIIFANELNRDAALTWCKNRPEKKEVMHIGDIEHHAEKINPNIKVNVVFGGPPCQGFSIAGKMNKDDPRNLQIDSFFNVVESAEPDAFLLENVKALATHTRWKSVRSRMLERARVLGYETCLIVSNSKDYGVPENRERMLFVGIKIGLGSVESFVEAFNNNKTEPPNLRDVLLSVGPYGSKQNPNTCTAKVVLAKKPVKRGSAYTGMLVNGSGRPINLDQIAPTLTASMGGNKTPIVDQVALTSPASKNWFEKAYQDIENDGYSDQVVPSYIRRLTIREAAAIQTFPLNYKFHGSKCSQYRQIGNAVPCNMARAAASAILKTLSEGKSKERN